MTTTSRVWTRNEVTFMGRLGQDPDMSYTTGGKALTKFSLAINQGQNKDAMWLNVVCWEDVAEQANKETRKGALVEVKGRLTQRKYNDKYYHDVVAESVEVVEGPKERKQAKPETDPLGDLDDHPF
jgi:single-strand DNA-binding protein